MIPVSHTTLLQDEPQTQLLKYVTIEYNYRYYIYVYSNMRKE